MMPMQNHNTWNTKFIILTVAVAVLIILAGVWVYTSKRKYTLKEFMEKAEDIESSDYETEYWIKDTVITATSFKIPKIVHDGEYKVDTTKTNFYTLIFFESLPESQLYLIGDRADEFPSGKTVTFSITPKEVFIDAIDLVKDYSSAVYFTNFSALSFQKELINDNTTYLFRVVEITDFAPFPTAYWDNVTIGFGNENETIPHFSLTINRGDGTSVGQMDFKTEGLFDKATIPQGMLIKEGDYLEFEHHPSLESATFSLGYLGGIVFAVVNISDI